ncbi:Oidioi.mRNA.OKI2018_I69.PAR.g9340.t1.cds [Oikopleura dioica]|uniref:Oidioi.mRNA.OKI2018_I69.PAR.g9340.t1.cds n=1 Tax=Oikopleura dioica TaxID=34765 RepID=A0ABN7RK41_OIKDI|nr:Oidioi.mRNA.OKI2018_I69.PAR.g9340.t1.cds [Oikopleura dioica]
MNEKSVTSSCSLAWENLKVQTKKGLPILKDLTGELPAGSLTAILGRSGCGKTTLMNVLTCNNHDLEATGNIYLNRVPVGSAISNVSAYVRQEDLFVGELTVLEHLNFRARIQFSDLEQEERDRRIQKSLRDFELKEVEHTQIGIPDLKKTLSGGERKRLSLASEILSDPKILFCDEPTTGLDSTMAMKVIEVLVNLSKKGMTIVCSIHQPSSKIISMFSHLILMAKGEFAYFGKYVDSISFVEKLNRPVPPLYNPADHFLDILDPNNAENEDFISSAVDLQRSKIKLSIKNDEKLDNLDYLNLRPINEVGRISQTCILIRRQLARMIRDPLAVKAKLCECIFIAIWYGMLYWRRDNAWSNETFQYSWAQIRDVNGSLLVSLLFVSILFMVMVALRFMVQWPLLQREVSDKIYRFSSFFIADNIVTSFFAIVLPFLYSIIAYPLFGLQKSFMKWLTFYFVLVLESHVCLGVGYCVSSFSPNIDFTIALLPAAIVPLIVFCGYLLDTSATPPYAGFLKHLSWYG